MKVRFIGDGASPGEWGPWHHADGITLPATTHCGLTVPGEAPPLIKTFAIESLHGQSFPSDAWVCPKCFPLLGTRSKKPIPRKWSSTPRQPRPKQARLPFDDGAR